MNILLLSFGIPSKKNPQAGCFAMDQAIALRARGHKVGILSLNGKIGKEWKKPGVRSWRQDGIECFEAFGMPVAITSRLLGPKMAAKLTQKWAKSVFPKVVKKFGFPDIVHAHFLNTMLQGAAIKKAYPITLVGTEHWSKLAEPKLGEDIKYYGNYSYPEVDRLICVSKELAVCVKNHFGKDSIVVHNLFNTSSLKPAITKTENDSYTITAVGSLIPRKGFDILIKAFAKSALTDKNVVVNIYGKGASKNELEELIVKSDLVGKVNLCGQKNKDSVYEALRNSNLFVLSSRQETFSVAIIEATGNGVPAVATLCGIVNEFDFHDVIKVPTDNVDAMKDALEKAFEKRESVDRKAIQQQTIDNFSPEAIIKKVEEVYKDVLKEKKEQR